MVSSYQPDLASVVTVTPLENILTKQYNKTMTEYTIELSWDDEAAVWVAVNDEIPIALESGSLDVLIERVKNATPELLEFNGKNDGKIVLLFSLEYQKVVA